MRKYLAIIIGTLFVLGFAASAFAVTANIPSSTTAVVAKGDTQITLGGSLRFRGEFKENTKDQLDGGTDDHDAKYDARVRLKVTAKVANVKGVVEVESDNGNSKTGSYYDQTGGSENWTWGGTQGSAKGIYRMGNTRPAELRIRQAWILYNGPVTLKIGHQPLALGNKLFFDHSKFGDDAIVVLANPTKALTVGALTAKFRESNSKFNDDANAYVGLVVYKGGAFNMSGDITYVDDQTGYVAGADAAHVWNIGLRGNTKVSGLTLRGDVELQTGKFVDAPAGKNIKGYALLGGIDYKLANNTKLTLETAYGSGDKNSTDDSFKTFITALGAQPHYTYVYEYRTKAATGITGTGIANTWYVKLGAAHKVTRNLSVKGAIFLLRAAEDVSLNGAANSKDLGWEADGKVTYKLARNLKYYVEGGYLFTGKAYDYAAKSADNVYAVRNGIQLSF